MIRNLVKVGIYLGVPLTLATTAIVADDTEDVSPRVEPNTVSPRKIKGKGSRNIKGKESRGASSRKLVRTYATAEKILWKPLFHQYESMKLSIAGPGIEPFSSTFAKGEPISFGIYDGQSTIWSDGVYKWELTAAPIVSDETKELMREQRNETTVADMGSLLRSGGMLPAGQDMKQSGTFAIADGQLVKLKGERQQRLDQLRIDRAEAAGFVADRDPLPSGVQLRDILHLDDVIVDFSLCVGNDCVNGESFGFDTIRLKENNLRIHFDDTSSSASFPKNDWRIRINDSSNGGKSYFAVEDVTGGRTPFLVEAGAPSNSLYVEADGDLGINTANPVVELHIVDGDTPTVRLEQDGSNGFTPQTWDLAGNETNFFIRDVTNGSKLPFRIRPSAPTSSIDVAADGDVGIGTASPDAPLHVRRTDGTAQIRIEETNSSPSPQTLLLLEKEGSPQMQFSDTANAVVWNLLATDDNSFQIDNPNETGTQFLIEEDGTVTASGTINGVSDRNVKRDITDISAGEILEKVADLPIHEWSYINDKADARHVGPMAQDFMKAFGLGKSDKRIGLLDSSGVALAAIKGLHEVVTRKDAELEALRSKTAELEAQMKILIEKIGASESTD